jgi:hypothetical protein
MTTTCCTSHCSPCGRHFHSVAAFDLHRVGKFATGRHCASPNELVAEDGSPMLEALTDSGECRMYATVECNVTVWTLAGARQKAAEAFTGSRCGPESPNSEQRAAA